MRKNAPTARFVFKRFELLSWIFTILLIASMIYSGYAGYNFVRYGNCNGPGEEFCIFDPLKGPFVDDDHLAVSIADVADKGVPAALFTMISRTIFRSIARQRKSPSQVMTEANNLLCEGNDTGMFVTAFLAYYHLPTGRLTYSNGGHNPALLFGPEGGCREFAVRHGPALGVKSGLKYHEDIDTLEPGQVLVIYTDGVTEACSPDDELFGLDRFTKLVCRCDRLNLPQLFEHIDKELKSFQRGNQFDDITMLALKRKI